MVLRGVIFAVAVIAASNSAVASNFYVGKTINVIVGYGPGGGYDLYARLLARHLGRHLAGTPAVVVQNMSGAGSLRAANYVYNVAAQDGTVIAAVNQTLPLYALMGGEGIQFEAKRLQWLGRLESSNSVLVTFKSSHANTLEEAKLRDVPLGGSGSGSDSSLHATALNRLLGTRFKLVEGYKGARDIHLAMERGEVAGRAGVTWSSILASDKSWIDEQRISVLVQLGFKREVDLPQVPLLTELIPPGDGQQLAKLLSIPVEIGFAHWVGPNVPSDRLIELREAYGALSKDKQFIGEATKASVRLRPGSSSDIAALIDDAAATPQGVLRQLKEMVSMR